MAADAIELLTDDHEQVAALFDEYDEVSADADDAGRRRLAQGICDALTVHAQLEEEVFYPAARGALTDESLVDAALADHAEIADMITEIESMDAADAAYDAGIRELRARVERHVEREENELFAQFATMDLDVDELGTELAERRSEIEAMRDPGIREPTERYPAGPSM